MLARSVGRSIPFRSGQITQVSPSPTASTALGQNNNDALSSSYVFISSVSRNAAFYTSLQ